MNDTKPRPVLSIKKTPPVTASEPTQNLTTPQAKTASTQKPQKQPHQPKERSPVFKCLQAHWPNLFSIKHPVPLKIGILTPIIEHLKQAGEPFTATQIGRAIGEHCRSFEYLKALTNAPHRVGIDGGLSPISEQDRASAMKWLKDRCKTKNKKAELLKTEKTAPVVIPL